ncbi:uncharacterized protein TNIN_53961 [Trichonephila inaurata madagascariensis]|uniref:Uncharacterized protein n=1 Tax=Trichonephila inaurata madagascariensis TaxID=2747483 RepID=A0A8X7CCU0_9ARAC|nr:uncharacterized protein TNIN_53961 [Trichonephila inaurata madagascariensis]
MPRSKKVFKNRNGKYYKRRKTINSKVSTTDSKVNVQAGHAHDSKESCAKEKKIPNLNESFSSFDESVGTQIATIKTRFGYAMRSIGRSTEGGIMFCGIMNHPQPITRFSPYGKRILNAATYLQRLHSKCCEGSYL